jgi:hypothetical protein
MKTFKITLASGETRTVQADYFGPRRSDFRGDADMGKFTAFSLSPDPKEVLVIRTDEIVTIEEVDGAGN